MNGLHLQQKKLDPNTATAKHIHALALLSGREFERPSKFDINQAKAKLKDQLDSLDDECRFTSSFFESLVELKHRDEDSKDCFYKKETKPIFEIFLTWCISKKDKQLKTIQKAIEYGLFTKEDVKNANTAVISGLFWLNNY